MQSIAQEYEDRDIVSLILLERVRFLLSEHLKKVVVSKSPEFTPVSITARLAGQLKSKKEGIIGQVKVTVVVPRTEVQRYVTIQIDWTKNLHGFWWTRTIILKDAIEDPWSVGFGPIHSIIFDINMARKNIIRTEWLNRKYEKLKKKKGEGVKLPQRV